MNDEWLVNRIAVQNKTVPMWESVTVSSQISITRIPEGWLYNYYLIDYDTDQVIFVPIKE